jgi:hypothetical protein
LTGLVRKISRREKLAKKEGTGTLRIKYVTLREGQCTPRNLSKNGQLEQTRTFMLILKQTKRPGGQTTTDKDRQRQWEVKNRREQVKTDGNRRGQVGTDKDK